MQLALVDVSDSEKAAHEEKERYERENIDLQAKVDAADDLYAEVDMQMQQAVEQAVEWQAKCESAEEDLRTQQEAAQRDVSRAQVDVRALQAEIEKLKDETKMGKLQRVIDQQAKEEVANRELIAELKTALEAMDAEEAALKARNEELEAHMTQVRES